MKTIRPLKNHESASAKIIAREDGTISLISYSTDVCGIKTDGSLYCNGLYSMTTRKHISWFAREYGLTLADFKSIV